jgi:GNAT superfamily N-acetyltransferase
MSETEKYVTMVNANLSEHAIIELPSDIEVLWYENGNEDEWVDINGAADEHNAITKDLFNDQFMSEKLSLDERQCFLKDQKGALFATGTAWEGDEGEFVGYGRPHWIAVLPVYQRKGYGKAITSIVLNRLVSLGYEKAYLTTSTNRPNAIKLYEKFGFEIAKIEDPG